MRVGSGQRALAPATLATARTPNVKDSASSPLKGTRSATVLMARLGCIAIKVGCVVFIMDFMECSIIRPLLFPIRIGRTVGKLLGGEPTFYCVIVSLRFPINEQFFKVKY